MKVSITYSKEEAAGAARIEEWIRRQYPRARVRKSAREAPTYLVYIVIRKKGESGGNTT